MNIKKMTLAAFATASAVAAAAVPEVTSVTMSQSADRLVTISYTLSDAPAVVTVDVQTNASGDVWASIGGAAVCNAQGDVWKKVETGSRTITWRPDLSWPDHKIADGGARAVVTAWALDNTPDYMVVDISDGAQPNTQKYYPSADFLPGGLLVKDDYRTSSLVMRKIMAKDIEWTMGSTPSETQRVKATVDLREATHKVSLTNNYYIGVFPITQTQWSLVATNSTAAPTFTMEGGMRPMEKVCYNEIRLKANSNAAATSSEIADYSWPKAPNPSSFLGLLQSKTGIDFDLPGDAQWEFAARAGNGDTKWGDGTQILNTDTDSNLAHLGRYSKDGGLIGGTINPDGTAGVTNGTAIVGSYAPNDWGIYDMHGNVHELCLDWFVADIRSLGGKINIDPANPAAPLSGSSDQRCARGGSFSLPAGNSRPAFRARVPPTNRVWDYGFRVVCTAGLK